MRLGRPVIRSIGRSSLWGHDCIVVAPSLIPRRRQSRQNQSTRCARASSRRIDGGVGSDETHEAIRDLVRTRALAVRMRGASAITCTSFLLRDGPVYDRKASWRGKHERAGLTRSFTIPRSGVSEMLNAVQTAAEWIKKQRWSRSFRTGRWRRWLQRQARGAVYHRSDACCWGR